MAGPERGERYLVFLFSICFLGGVFGGVAATLLSAYLLVISTEFGGNPDSVGAAVQAAYLFGMTAGGLATGLLADRLGRKLAVVASIAAIGLFMLLTGLAESWAAIGVFRFFTGMGVGGVLVATPTLVAEVWPGRGRDVALGILSTTIPVGIFSAGLVTYQFSGWRTGFAAGAAPLGLAVLGCFFLKESEKWRADRFASKQADRPPASIFAPSTRRDLLVASLIYGSMLVGLWAIFSWLPTWVMSLVLDGDGQRERGTSMMCFAVGGLAGGLVSGGAMRLFGARRLLLSCFLATFSLSIFLFKTNTSLGPAVWWEVGGIAFFFGMSQGVLNAYVPGLFPTAVRSTATGFCFNICRFFTASAVFVVGRVEVALGGYANALLVFSLVFLLGWVATWFAHERHLI